MLAGVNRCCRGCQIQRLTGAEDRVQRDRQLSLADAIVRQRQQTDHGATGIAWRLCGKQLVPGMAECVPWKQLVAVDQIASIRISARRELGQCAPCGSSTRPLCFNDFHKPLAALGDGDAGVSLAPFRKTGSPAPPLLGAP